MLKKNLKRWTSLLAAGTMVVTSLAGCSGSKEAETTAAATTAAANTSNTTVETTAAAAAAPAEPAFADYSNGFPSQVTIQIPVFDRAFEGWNVTDNYYTDWVQKEFGDKYNVKVEYVAISRSSQVNDYMQLLASGKAPDIIFHYDMPQMLAYYGEESMQPLNLDEIAYYAPTYWANMSETIKTYGAVEGQNYFVFAARPEQYNEVALIRQDWLDAVNMDMPTSLEELNAVLAAWKEAGLGHGGGRLIMNSYTFDYPYRSTDMTKEENALYSDLAVAAFPSQQVHDYLKNLNYQYNNGLIDTEFYLNTDDASTQADFIAGNAGVMVNYYISSGTTIIDNLLVNNPDAKIAYLPKEALTPEGNTPNSRAFWPFGMIMGINQDCTDEERAAVWMYLDWLSDADNLFYFQNGIEGQNYTLDADGLAVKIDGYEGESKLSQNNNKDYWCLITESATYATEELTHKANLKNWAPAGYEYLIEDAYADFKATAEYRKPDALFTVVISSLAEYKAELGERWKELYVKCAMAPEAEFEAVYEECCQDFLDSGYQEILDEKQAAIDAGAFN